MSFHVTVGPGHQAEGSADWNILGIWDILASLRQGGAGKESTGKSSDEEGRREGGRRKMGEGERGLGKSFASAFCCPSHPRNTRSL